MILLDHKKLLNVTRITPDNVAVLTDWLALHPAFGWDVETNFKKTFFARKMRTMQFGWTDRQFFVDLRDFCGGDGNLLAEVQGNYGVNLFAAPKLKAFLGSVSPFLCSDK